MVFDYPYTDMHELNLDWFLAKFKDLVETWNNVESEWTSLHDYVQNYFENLNVQTEIDNKINAMILNGTFADIVSPFVTAALPALVAGQLPDVVAAQISSVVAAQISAVVADQLPAVAAAAAAQEVGTWLAAHIDPDTGYVIDDTLTVSQAAADAKTVGDIFTGIIEQINGNWNCNIDRLITTWNDGYYNANGTINAANPYSNIYSPKVRANYVRISVQTSRQYRVVRFNVDDGTVYDYTSWQTVDGVFTGDYLYGISFATTASSSITHDEVLSKCKAAVRRDLLLTSPVELVKHGGWTTISTPESQFATSGNLYFELGDTITIIQNDIKVAIVDNAGTTIVPWFTESYEIDENFDISKQCRILVKHITNNIDLDLDACGHLLSDYILENYTSINREKTGNAIVGDDYDANFSKFYDTFRSVYVPKINSKWHGKKVAFLGDSITYGVNTTSGHIYYQLLNDAIGFSSVYADGIAGSGYSSIGTTYTPIVERTGDIPADTDLIIIFAGTNDFGHSVPIGTITDTTDISFYGAVAKTFIDIVTAFPSSRLAIMTPLHRTGTTYRAEDDPNSVDKVLLDYVNALKAVAAKYSIPVIDTYSIYGLNPAIPIVKSSYITDGLHPNNAGHELLAKRIIDLIELL